MKTYDEIIKALECFAIDKDFDCSQCVGCAFETKGLCYENASKDIAKATLDFVKHQKTENKNLKEALGVAMDCIADCEYSLTKVCNSRVEVAVNNWNEYVENNDVYNLIRETVGEE